MAAAVPMLAACVTDVRRRIIPDWTVVTLGLIGLAQAIALETVPWTLLAAGVALGTSAVAARLGVWGWGDAKLIGAAGAVVGWPGLLPLFAGTAIAGGLFAAILLMLGPPVRSGGLSLPAGMPRWLRAEQTRLRRAPSVPYALAIAAGLALALTPSAGA